VLLTLWVCGLIDLYFAHETGITMQPYVPYGWQRKGNPLRIMCRTKSERLNLFGLMSLDNRLSIYHSEQSLTGGFIVDSINDFANKGHAEPVVIVLDNGPIHRCQAFYERLADWEQKEVYLHFLPTYSPQRYAAPAQPDRDTLAGPPVRVRQVPLAPQGTLRVVGPSEKSGFRHSCRVWD